VPARRTGVASPTARALACAALGGVLYFLGYVGFGLWPLLLVFLVPLWLAVDAVRGSAQRAALAGLVFGAVAYAGGFGWLWRLVEVFLGGDLVLGAALWLAHGLVFAAGFAVYALLHHALRVRGFSVGVAGVPTLVVVEWLQPAIFPVTAGSGLVHGPAVLVQIADLGGPLLLTAFLALVDVAAFEVLAWLRGARSLPWRPLAVVAGATACVTLYGTQRIAALDAAVRAAPALRVGLVQANLGVLEKRRHGIVAHDRHLAQTRELLAEDADLDLVVWPESAYPRGIRRPLPVSGALVRGDLRVPLLFGGTAVEEQDGRRVKRNSVFLVDRDGTIRTAYDKNLLIPLAEYAPLARQASAIAAALPHVQDFRAAEETPVLELDSVRIATPICYEAIRPELVRRMVRDGEPHLLVTLANDAWFGDSQEPWMHLALARLRAVEHRRFLVRSTNSGVSALVDPAGRVVARTGLLARENLRGTVALLQGKTLYARFGDWPAWFAAVLVAGAFVLRPRRRPVWPRP
jgi:apolipoprotein N-acyltransferase